MRAGNESSSFGQLPLMPNQLTSSAKSINMLTVSRSRSDGGMSNDTGPLDTRSIQPIQEVSLPFKRRRAPTPSTSNSGGSETSRGNNTARRPTSSSSSSTTNEDIKSQKSRSDLANGNACEHPQEDEIDVVNAAHLQDYHPRGMEPAATYLRPLELKRFASLLGSDDWEDVHDRVVSLGRFNSSKIREKYAHKKEELDQVGIFLPEANKLRIEAQIQVELRRTLQYEALERAILYEMLEREKLESASAGEKNAAELQASFQAVRRTPPKISRATSPTLRNLAKNNESSRPASREDSKPEASAEEQNETEVNHGMPICNPLLSFEEYRNQITAQRTQENGGSLDPGPSPHVQSRALGGHTNDKIRLRNPRSVVPVGDVLRNKRKPRIGPIEKGTSQHKPNSVQQEQRERLIEHLQEIENREREEAGLPPVDEYFGLDINDDEDIKGPEARARRQKSREQAKKKRLSEISSQMENIATDSTILYQLQALFDLLEIPPARRLDLMIKYSDPARAMDFIDVLNDWERVAKIVTLHEKVVKVVILADARKVEASSAFTEDETEELESLDCYVSMAQMFGASCGTWARAILEKLSPVCEENVRELTERWHDNMIYRGHDYLKIRFPSAAAKAIAEAEQGEASKQLREIRHGGSNQVVRLNPVLLKD